MKKNLVLQSLFVLDLVLVAVGCGGQSGTGDQGKTPPDSGDQVEWKLVFQEDFDSTAVDTRIWGMYDGPGHDGNGLRSPEAFSVEDGQLVITACMKDGQVVSGGMAHKANYTYGKYEFRVRTEPDPSGTTSGVVLTWPQSERWPVDGENDIYETGTEPTPDRQPFHTFIHYGEDNSQYHFQHDVAGDEWHVMSMEWFPDKLTIYRDGQEVWTLTDRKAIPQVPHHICLQLDAFKKEMTGTVRMYVDWVRIFQAEKTSED